MSSINGFGTTFYGECDYQPDGTYLTTYWIILAFVPVIPLYSARIMQTESSFLGGGSLYHYQKLPIHWPQVLRVWGFAAGVVVGFVACLAVVDGIPGAQDKGYAAAILMLYMIGVLLLPHFLRHRAKKRVGFSPNLIRKPAVSKSTLLLLAALVVLVIGCAVYAKSGG